jgi:hypothetical protein
MKYCGKNIDLSEWINYLMINRLNAKKNKADQKNEKKNEAKKEKEKMELE